MWMAQGLLTACYKRLTSQRAEPDGSASSQELTDKQREGSAHLPRLLAGRGLPSGFSWAKVAMPKSIKVQVLPSSSNSFWSELLCLERRRREILGTLLGTAVDVKVECSNVKSSSRDSTRHWVAPHVQLLYSYTRSYKLRPHK